MLVSLRPKRNYGFQFHSVSTIHDAIVSPQIQNIMDIIIMSPHGNRNDIFATILH